MIRITKEMIVESIDILRGLNYELESLSKTRMTQLLLGNDDMDQSHNFFKISQEISSFEKKIQVHKDKTDKIIQDYITQEGLEAPPDFASELFLK